MAMAARQNRNGLNSAYANKIPTTKQSTIRIGRQRGLRSVYTLEREGKEVAQLRWWMAQRDDLFCIGSMARLANGQATD